MAMPMLLGSVFHGHHLGADPIDAFLTAHPSPSSTDIADYLKAFDPDTRAAQAQALIARGVDSRAVANALTWLDTSNRFRGAWPTIAGVLSLTSAAASGYHGYKRNESLGWALWWFLMGSIFPVVTPVIALAQGFGKKKAA